MKTTLSLWVRWEQVENIRKTEEKYYFNKKVCVINKLAWMFCKIDGINYYRYQRDGELCQGKVMGWGWAFQWDPPYVTLV